MSRLSRFVARMFRKSDPPKRKPRFRVFLDGNYSLWDSSDGGPDPDEDYITFLRYWDRPYRGRGTRVQVYDGDRLVLDRREGNVIRWGIKLGGSPTVTFFTAPPDRDLFEVARLGGAKTGDWVSLKAMGESIWYNFKVEEA